MLETFYVPWKKNLEVSVIPNQVCPAIEQMVLLQEGLGSDASWQQLATISILNQFHFSVLC
jgi:hypothetical protein